MKAKLEPSISGNISIVLTEMEARALEGMIAYGPDNFLDMFYSHLGKAYLKEYESGVRKLFLGVQDIISPMLLKIERVRKTLNET